ncbi:hypothetical protein HPB50_024533 [Hyalomma asiaticum]|uniref:Uncharacterized protein n=1 Tax=Hyalomma asiaticum TaxID=266040 RepID=A0ACB7SKH6_HYAAI|nr:hypothetical protein HPB50_024533 [Hyalomma asiaticum]
MRSSARRLVEQTTRRGPQDPPAPLPQPRSAHARPGHTQGLLFLTGRAHCLTNVAQVFSETPGGATFARTNSRSRAFPSGRHPQNAATPRKAGLAHWTRPKRTTTTKNNVAAEVPRREGGSVSERPSHEKGNTHRKHQQQRRDDEPGDGATHAQTPRKPATHDSTEPEHGEL